jgi:hypothetical protein
MHDLETVMGWTFYSGMLIVLNYSSEDEREAIKLLFNSKDEVLNDAYESGKFAVKIIDSVPTHKIPKDFDEVKLKNLIHVSLTSLHEQNHIKQVPIYPSVLLNGTLKSLLFDFIKTFIKQHHSNQKIKIPIVNYLNAQNEFNKYALRGKWYYELIELIAGTKSERIEDCLKMFQSSFKESFVSNLNSNEQSNPFDFTLNDILEAECRQLDNMILYRWQSIGVDIDFIETIYQELIYSPVYTKAFKYFLDELQPYPEFSIKIFLLTIHLSLWADTLHFEKKVLWEDISTPWRFYKIVQWFKNNKTVYGRSFDELIQRICFELKWKTPREIALKHIRLRNQILAGCRSDFDKDFYERHFDYCYYLIDEGYVPNLYLGIELENRFYPWCVYKKDLGLVIQNVPSNVDPNSIIQHISMLRTSIALYFTGDLSKAKNEYDMLNEKGKHPSLNHISHLPVGNYETFLQSVFGIKSENVLLSK